MEELKRRNAPQPIPTQTCPSKEKWQELLHRLDELERHTAAHTALLREVSSRRELCPPGADGGAGAGCDGDTGAAATGWEEERTLYLSSQSGNRDVCYGMAGSDFAGDDGGLANDLVRLGRSLERDQATDPVRDATTTPIARLFGRNGRRSPKATPRTITKKNRLGSRPCDGLLLWLSGSCPEERSSMRTEYEEYRETGMLGGYDPGGATLRETESGEVLTSFRDTCYQH